MSSAGISDATGASLTDFSHVVQSIGIILTTPVGSRVMRREFGSELHDLIDRPMNEQVVLAMYSSIVTALTKWEPRYRVTKMSVDGLNAAGEVTMTMTGIYYPRGHLGDFTVNDGEKTVVIPITRYF